MTDYPALRADFEALSEIGRAAEGGWSRPAFGDADCAAHDWFLDRARACGLDARYDAFGNAIARTPGQGPAIAIGSHLDTVMNGGAFDGALGVLAGLEVARRSVAAGIAMPIEVIAFRDEEGRFGPFTGSRAMTGAFDLSALEIRRGQDGVLLVDAMRAAGFEPTRISEVKRDFADVACYLELHIEQGRVLEQRGDTVGLVTAIAGQVRFAIRFTGQPDHAGTTPMDLRHDAFAAAARFADRFRDMILADVSDTLRGTIGVVRLHPGQANVIPGEVRLALEIRDTDAAALARAAQTTPLLVEETGRDMGCTVKLREVYSENPVPLDPDLLSELENMAQLLGVKHSRLLSGANHDAGIMAAHVPTALIFVLSKDGRSHCPEEHTDWASITDALAVLEQSVARIAERRA